MGLQFSSVSKSSPGVAMPTAASLRAGITNLYRRADLAPAVLIIAGISFVVHVLVGNNYGYFRDELYLMAMSHIPPSAMWMSRRWFPGSR